ncbi:MAG: C40 family peptidase [Bacteroidia bacterium]|nr:C40 family peptidase [Bacteroidia bacterium]
MKATATSFLSLLFLFLASESEAQTTKIKDTIIQLYLLQQNPDSINRVQPEIKKNRIADSLFAYAISFTGRHYKRNGSGINGFDCSGYTMMVFKHFGIKLPHTSAGQSLVGIEIKQKHIKKGDLLFFKGRNSRRKRIGHVGIVISEITQPIRFIHSSTSHGVRIDNLEADYYKRRFMKATRILPL